MSEIKTNSGPTIEEIAIIEKVTGGIIGTYEWWEVRGVDGTFKSHIKPKHEADIIYHGILKNSFMSHNGTYIGDLLRAEWYQKHHFKVYEPHPLGVAEVYKDEKLVGYCGYTHRAASVFNIGDRLFEEHYKPKQEDYTPLQWVMWVEEYDKALQQAKDTEDNWWFRDIESDGIGRFIPFKLRGSKLIETFDECIQAAINLSNYLS
jgi:hypothetical protein